MLQTDRLLLRRLTHEDVDDLLEVLGDAQAMRHYPALGRGYATEAALAWQSYARDRLVAIVAPENVASQRVAFRMGMSPEREFVKNGLPTLLFLQRL